MGINLDKKTEAAGIVLTKRKLTNPPSCEVGVAIDISGSMQDEYRDGIVQDVAERLFALAMRFDLDKKLDVWTYDDAEPTYVGPVVLDNIENFVKNEIINNGSVKKWGGTNYAPALRAIRDHYFTGTKKVTKSGGFFGMFKKETVEETGGAANGSPVLLFFITDGENFDHDSFEKILRELRTQNIYIQIVGIGNANLRYVNRVADAEPNVGFCQITDVRKLTDEQMMEMVVTEEFAGWIKKF